MGGLVMLSAWRHVPQIEQQLLDQVQTALAPLVSAPVTVSMDGHHATIAGTVADATERDALLSAMASVPGVRTVMDRMSEASASPGSSPEAPAPAESLVADASPGPGSSVDDPEPAPSVSAEPLSNDLPAELAEAPPTEPVPDELPPEPLAEGPSDAQIPEPQPTEPLAEAPPIDQLAAAPSADDDDSPLDPAALTMQDKAIEAPLPSLSLAVVNEALMLEGRIGTDQDLRELVEPALEAFDPSYLTNQIDTTAPTAQADWLEPVAGLLPQLAELSQPSLDIVDRQITLAGTAPSRGSHDRLVNLAIDAFSDYTVVERVEVDISPDPVAMPDDDARVTTDDRPEPAALTARNVSGPLARSLAALDSERLAFESGSDVLTSNSAERLDELADLFIDHPDITVEIEGHTDATGSAELNLSLSQKRASAVKRALVDRGVQADRLIAYGYGEGVPLASNATAEGRARNRRIEFRF